MSCVFRSVLVPLIGVGVTTFLDARKKQLHMKLLTKRVQQSTALKV